MKGNEVYSPHFTRNEVFQEGNTIELRNGNRYICEIENIGIKKMITLIPLSSDISERDMISTYWDYYCFYGVNSDMDVVKWLDKNGITYSRNEYRKINFDRSHELLN